MIKTINGCDENALKAARAAAVKSMWEELMRKNGDEIILDHTNAIYIIRKDDRKQLIVYVDESIFSAELNARRELIKLQFLQHFNEEIDDFEIHISRGTYKKNHPFRKSDDFSYQDSAEPIPLTDEERGSVADSVSGIANPGIRASLEKAMTVDLEWKKGIESKNNRNNTNHA